MVIVGSDATAGRAPERTVFRARGARILLLVAVHALLLLLLLAVLAAGPRAQQPGRIRVLRRPHAACGGAFDAILLSKSSSRSSLVMASSQVAA